MSARLPGQAMGEHYTAYGREWLRNIPDTTPDQQAKAKKYIEANALNEDDHTQLLDILGLNDHE